MNSALHERAPQKTIQMDLKTPNRPNKYAIW